MKDEPGARIDSQLSALGDSLAERTGRLAADISHSAARIEMLQTGLIWTGTMAVVLGVVLGITFMSLWKLP